MTREEAKELMPIIQAFAEGKAIQDKIEGLTDWYDTDEINFEYNGEKIIHRIKPEPKYRPFKTQEECWEEMQKHQPFGWLIRNNNFNYVKISVVSPHILMFGNKEYDYEEAFKHYNFADGTPFGIKEG